MTQPRPAHQQRFTTIGTLTFVLPATGGLAEVAADINRLAKNKRYSKRDRDLLYAIKARLIHEMQDRKVIEAAGRRTSSDATLDLIEFNVVRGPKRKAAFHLPVRATREHPATPLPSLGERKAKYGHGARARHLKDHEVHEVLCQLGLTFASFPDGLRHGGEPSWEELMTAPQGPGGSQEHAPRAA